jgi:hypothetical protein
MGRELIWVYCNYGEKNMLRLEKLKLLRKPRVGKWKVTSAAVKMLQGAGVILPGPRPPADSYSRRPGK